MKQQNDSSVKYFGVCESNEKFKAQINRRGKVFYLGTYETSEEAAAVVDSALNQTLAWSTRAKESYNFGSEGRDPSVGGANAEKYVTAMKEWLKAHYPTDNEALEKIDQTKLEGPSDTIARAVNLAAQVKGKTDLFLSVIEDLRKGFFQLQGEMATREKEVAFYKQRVSELEAQVIELSDEKKRISVERKWTFKPVGADVPKDAAPEVVVFPAGSIVPIVFEPSVIEPAAETESEDAEISIPGEQQ